MSREPREAGEALEESQLFDAIDEPDEVPTPWIPQHSGEIIEPARHASVWTLTAPLAHGADEKDGNVSRFRCEARLDTLTGKWVDVPVFAGNAVRGMMRDLLMIDAMTLVGVSSQRARTDRARAALRRTNQFRSRHGGRRLAPPTSLAWPVSCGRSARRRDRESDDGGRLRCPMRCRSLRNYGTRRARDRSLSLIRALSLRAFHACKTSSKCAQLTRMAHREIDGDGGQMIAKTECIRAGTQFVHKSHSRANSDKRLVVRACLVRALRLLQDNGVMGAGPREDSERCSSAHICPHSARKTRIPSTCKTSRRDCRPARARRSEGREAREGQEARSKDRSESKVEPVSPGDEDVLPVNALTTSSLARAVGMQR